MMVALAVSLSRSPSPPLSCRPPPSLSLAPSSHSAAACSLSALSLPPSLTRQLQSRQTCSSWLVARLPNSKLESAARAV